MQYPQASDLKHLLPGKHLAGFLDALPSTFRYLKTPMQLAHFIAQCGIESDHFRTYEEYASGAAYEGRRDLGNTQPGDGKRFKGRGPLQLTGRSNYKRATPFVKKLFGQDDFDLVATPALVATNHGVGLATSLWYWSTNKLNLPADRNDARAVSRGVNRGDPQSRKPANHEAQRVALTAKVLAIVERLQKGDTLSPTGRPRILRKGDTGVDVAKLQEELIRHGSDIVAMGTFDQATERAVKAFQMANDLRVDGIVGPLTLDKL